MKYRVAKAALQQCLTPVKFLRIVIAMTSVAAMTTFAHIAAMSWCALASGVLAFPRERSLGVPLRAMNVGPRKNAVRHATPESIKQSKIDVRSAASDRTCITTTHHVLIAPQHAAILYWNN